MEDKLGIQKLLFSKRILFVILVLAVIVLLTIPSMLRTDKKMKRIYTELVGAGATNAATPFQTTQTHRKTNKEILFTARGQRLQLIIASKDSTLVVDRNSKSTDLIECMNHVDCYMQEELYYLLPDGQEVKKNQSGEWISKDSGEPITFPKTTKLKPMQCIRYLDAEKASYCYQTDHFTAENVTISRFKTEGHRLKITKGLEKTELLMTGFANSVEFSLGEENILFNAHQLKATFHRI